MINVIGVRFKSAGKVYYFDPLDFNVKKGDNVIVETAFGVEYGEVVSDIKQVLEEELVAPLKAIMRVADEEDAVKVLENKEKAKEAFAICEEKVKEHNLEMNLIEAEYTFDRGKVLFYFTAEGRIDFRELVKDLASVFRTRIELRQIGVRDEAKMLGGCGICGRSLCCKTFLGEFHPVSIKMAKEQGLSLNPVKISGCCGRLMCCLKYEQDAYDDILSRLPVEGAIVKTPEGTGEVASTNVLKELVYVKLNKKEATELREYKLDEIKLVKGKYKSEESENIDDKAFKNLE